MGRINFAYKDYLHFFTTYTCTNEDVDEEFFRECMKVPQTPRPFCEAMNMKALCEQCEHFGRRAEYISQRTGEHKLREQNGVGKDIAAEPPEED